MRVLLIALSAFLFWKCRAFANSAKVSACAQTFANSSDAGIRDKEVLATYTSLIKELGADLSPALLKKVYDSGNPFQLPETVGTSNSVRSSLSQLEEMLRTHTKDIEPYKKLILAELLNMSINQKSTEQRIEIKLKTPEIRFEQMRWGSNMSNIVDLNGWYLGIPNISGKSQGFLFWHPKDGLIKRPFLGEAWPDYVAYSPALSTLYYSSQHDEKNLIFKLKLLDGNGSVLPELKPKLLSFKRLSPKKYISGIEISPDGKQILFAQKERCLVGQLTATTVKNLKPVYTHKLIAPTQGGFDAEFIGDSKLGIMTSESFQVYDLTGKARSYPIPIKEIPNWSVSQDGKYLFLGFYANGEIPYGERWDLEKLEKSKKSKPDRFSLGYLGQFNSGRTDTGALFALSGTPYVVQLFYGIQEKGPFELRVINPSTDKVLYRENLPIPNSLHKPEMSPDHSKFRAYRWNDEGTPMFIWHTEYLRDSVESGKEAP